MYNMSPPNLSELLSVAQTAAYEGGQSTLGFYGREQLAIETKPDASPVTEADKQAEKIILSIIRARRPEDPIIAEESGETSGSGKYRWIIDPIDGTKSFIAGIPFYGTTIGVEDTESGDIVVGILYFPALNDMLWAVKDHGTFRNGRRVRVAPIHTFSETVLLATDIRHIHEAGLSGAFHELISKVKFFRTWGDCYGHFLVATGRAGLMIDAKMKIWDSAPLKPIIEEAGGVFCDRAGKADIRAESVFSGTPDVMQQFLEIIKRHTI